MNEILEMLEEPYGEDIDEQLTLNILNPLIIMLGQMKTLVTKVRENRIGRNFPIPDSKSYKNKPHGYIASTKNVEDDTILVHWKDSNVVTMVTV